LPSISYDDSVDEALCFGWIDSLIKSIDDRFHMRLFTPRKPKSRWSAANRARATRLTEAGLMADAGLDAVAQAKRSRSWNAHARAEALRLPVELRRALRASAAATRHWPTYTASARRGFLRFVGDARQAETRARRVAEVIDLVARNVSMSELRAAAMGSAKASRAPAMVARPSRGGRSTRRVQQEP
jgi:uncharacterized protein YdeI (YjbR/CyaY-like superfamily)